MTAIRVFVKLIVVKERRLRKMWSKLKYPILGVYVIGIIQSIVQNDGFICFILILELILVYMTLRDE